MMNNRTIYFSRILALTYTVIGAVSYLTNGITFHQLALNPTQMLFHQELWRLITFTLLPSTLEGTILFVLVFWFIAPVIEKKYQMKTFVLLLFLAASIQGALSTLLFWQKNIFLAGGEGISFFVLTLYMLHEVSSNKLQLAINKIQTLHLVILLTVVWFSAVLLHNSFTVSAHLNYSLISSSYGILLGTVLFMQIKASKKLLGGKRHIENTINIHNPEELIGSMSIHRKTILQNHFDEELDEETEFEQDEYFSEERLNAILDKINEYGTEALSSDEKLYLEEYSQYI